jgi:protein-L-isoaspartate(D-aspartate) O-methyltransferase
VLFVPMTGKAEDIRKRQPDPKNPALSNGGFEEVDPATTEAAQTAERPEPGPPSDRAASDPQQKPAPVGWHYRRQLNWVEDDQAPEGQHYVTFDNSVPGRGAQALQGLAVDGREVNELRVSLWVKCQNVRPGENRQQQPVLTITFYDDNRAQAGYTWVGPWRDSFDWQHTSEKVRVPGRAREAIVRIGLGGATGKISFDDVRIEKAE